MEGGLIALVLFVGLLALGVPVAFALGFAAAIPLIFFFGFPLSTIGTWAVGGVDRWIWLAIPLFILLGHLMNESGVTKRLIDFSYGIIGHLHGGYGHVTVITSALAGGMTGSCIADAAAEAVILAGPMKKQGLPVGYSAAIIATSSIIAVMIPPSIGAIVVGQVLETSILRLWFGGVVPAMITTLLLIGLGYFLSRHRGYPKAARRTTFREMRALTGNAAIAFVIPVVILGGIRLGFFTPTEAGAAGIFYVILVGMFVYRGFNVKGLSSAVKEIVPNIASVMFIIAMGLLFSVVITISQISVFVTEFSMRFITSPQMFMVVITIILLVTGCFIDNMPMTFIFAPLFGPIAASYGIDRVHFGDVFLFAILVGQYTPPYGLTMLVVCNITGASVAEYVKEGWPFVVGLAGCTFICALCPQVILWFPNLIM